MQQCCCCPYNPGFTDIRMLTAVTVGSSPSLLGLLAPLVAGQIAWWRTGPVQDSNLNTASLGSPCIWLRLFTILVAVLSTNADRPVEIASISLFQ